MTICETTAGAIVSMRACSHNLSTKAFYPRAKYSLFCEALSVTVRDKFGKFVPVLVQFAGQQPPTPADRREKMSTKNISVKVKVSVLIDALQKALAVREERFTKNEKTEADYKKAQEKWEADFVKAVVALVKNGKAKAKKASETNFYRHASDASTTTTSVELVLEVPNSVISAKPDSPDTYREWEYRADKEALEGAIRVLQMSENEVVSTSTYHSVVKYL
jgi:hypothetical protein